MHQLEVLSAWTVPLASSAVYQPQQHAYQVIITNLHPRRTVSNVRQVTIAPIAPKTQYYAPLAIIQMQEQLLVLYVRLDISAQLL